MKIRSFTLELSEIRRFLTSLRELSEDVEPLADSPPTETELVYEFL